MLKRSFFTMFILFGLLLTSCVSQEEAHNQECIVGTWQLSGNEPFARALLPPGSFEQDAIEFIDAGGVIGYSFDQQGKVYVDVIAWMTQLSVQEGDQNYPLDMNMIGQASGSYHLDGDQLSVTAVDQSNLAFEAFLDGMSMMRSLQVEEFAPLFSSAYPVAQIKCSETTLSLTILDQPGLTEPIEFQRVSQEPED